MNRLTFYRVQNKEQYNDQVSSVLTTPFCTEKRFL